MALHPLVAALKASFETVFVCPKKREHVLSFEFAQWADVPYASEDDIGIYYEAEKIDQHEMIMIDFVNCLQDMILEQDIPAKEILIDVFTQKTGSRSVKQLHNCHAAFIQQAENEMNAIGQITDDSDPIDQDNYYRAEDRKNYNHKLLEELYLPNTEVFYELYDCATELDQELQSRNNMLHSILSL